VLVTPGQYRWTTLDNIPLFLSLVTSSGAGASGKTPQVAIRRHKEAHGGLLDNYYWNGSAFVATPFYHTLLELDPVNQPGLYRYIFQQSLVAKEYEYLVHYYNDSGPKGFDVEVHTVVDDLARVLGLLHQNAIVDRQEYDSNGQLTYARVRVFDSALHVPTEPDGDEALGLIQKYEVTASWAGAGITTNYSLKRLL